MDITRPLLRSPIARCLVFFSLFFSITIVFPTASQAITKSVGLPYRGGRLIHGVPFPRQFSGYHLRQVNRTYATPELIGALLDAIEGVRRRYPKTCDLYLGDFSKKGGGRLRGHRSHQNGRDVDVGMYAKGNRELSGFKPMSRTNLDVPKTWCLIENLLATGRVQYIFMDRRLQRIFYQYASRHGWGKASLDRLFKNVGTAYETAIIRHARGHRDHIHVRFYAPWSALAAVTNRHDLKKMATISMAQEAYLPKKVKYYVKGDERNLQALAASFGVSYKDLCRWNNIRGQGSPGVGTCLVYYKRSFELEPVNLAQSLQAPNRINSHLLQVASLKQQALVDDSESPARYRTAPIRYRVKPGDSLYKIAKKYHLTVDKLCRMNHISKKSTLKIGQELRVGIKKTRIASRGTASTYTVKKGDTLSQIAERHHLTTRQLCALNGIQRSSTIRVGQKLKVTGSARSRPASTATYTIQPGDSLWSIARKHDTRVAVLCDLNGISKDQPLHPGQKLKVVGHRSGSTKTAYTIRSGDNLWTISKKYKTSVQSICAANGFSEKTILRPGTKIKIP